MGTFWAPNTISGIALANGAGVIPMVHTPHYLPLVGGSEGWGEGARHSLREKEKEHDLPNTMFYNTRYNEAVWTGLCDKARHMRNVIKRTNALRLDLLPPRPTITKRKNAPVTT